MKRAPMECRPACGACCIAPSISTPIPGMPHGKPAGIRCVQLTVDLRCAIFGNPDRPAWKNSSHVAHTAAVPPNQGKIILAIIG